MDRPIAITGEPPQSHAAVPADLVRRLVEASQGFEIAEPALQDEVEIGPSGESWQEAVSRSLAPQGFRTRRVFLSTREAVGAASESTPLVTCCGSSADDWFAVLDRSGDRVRLVTPHEPDLWLRAEALAARIQRRDVDEPVPWVLAEPTLPSASAASPGKSHGEKMPPLRRLLALLKPDRGDLWTVVLYAVAIGGLTLATPIAVQQLVNTVAFGGLVQPVVILALLLFGVLSFAGVLSAVQAYTAEVIQRRLFVRVVMDVAERLPRVDLRTFDRRHGPELVNRLFDLFMVQKLGAFLLLDGTSVLLQTTVGLLILSFYHPIMLAFSILLLGAIGVVILVLGRGAVGTAVGESNAKYDVVHWMEEIARHPSTFRSPGGRDHAIRRTDQLAARYVTARRRHYRIVLRQFSSALALQVLASSLLLALGGWLVVTGQLTLGQLVASELIITAIVAAVAKLGKQMESFYDLLAATDKLGVLLDLPLERTGGAVVSLGSGPARLSFQNLEFAYDGQPVFRNLAAEIAAGDRVAICGPDASGKSTLTTVLAGLRAPQKGFIALDDCDIREMALDQLRSQVVRVGEREIFSGSILDNLRVARPGLSPTEAADALARVGMLDAVRALPDGLRTVLATDGQPLARGQVAALMIARAMLAEPRVLILDEALIHLETSAREQVIDRLFSPEAPWTLIVVSDSPDVLDRCTNVIDLAGVETGAAA